MSIRIAIEIGLKRMLFEMMIRSSSICSVCSLEVLKTNGCKKCPIHTKKGRSFGEKRPRMVNLVEKMKRRGREVGEWWSGGVVSWWSGGVVSWWSGVVVGWCRGGVEWSGWVVKQWSG